MSAFIHTTPAFIRPLPSQAAARRAQPMRSMPTRLAATWAGSGVGGYSSKGGCSRRGVQWMEVVLYNKTAYNIM